MGLLRFLLASAVVLNHNGGFFRYDIVGGPIAVQTFFMISGFLMQLVLTKRYSGQSKLTLFYTNRIARLFPSYLCALFLTFAAGLFFYRSGTGYFPFLSTQAHWLDGAGRVLLAVTATLIIGQDLFLFMSHSAQGLDFSVVGVDPLVWPLQPIPQAWSLSIELCFYAIAPFIARTSMRTLVWTIVALASLRLSLSLLGFPHDPWGYRFFPSALPVFMLGMLAYRLRDRLTSFTKSPRALGQLFLGVSLVIYPVNFIARRLEMGTQGIEYFYLAFAFVAIPALFRAGMDGLGGRWERFDDVLGEFSYPIYITHWIFTSALAIWLPRHDVLTDAVRSALCLAMTLALSSLLVVGVERPIDRWRMRRSGRMATPSVRGAGPALEVDATYPG